MDKIIAFDIYGTLIDTHGVIETLQPMVGAQAAAVSELWRQTQLSYAFRRAVMQRYQNFGQCTAQALTYTCAVLNIDVSDAQKNVLLQCYASLPTFPDVVAGLRALQDRGYACYAFSNGSRQAVEALLAHNALSSLLAGVVSTDDVQSFKPDPLVYQHFAQTVGQNMAACYLVSSNAFDVIGAVSSGMRGIWLQRSAGNVFDPWEITPTCRISSLSALAETLDRL